MAIVHPSDLQWGKVEISPPEGFQIISREGDWLQAKRIGTEDHFYVHAQDGKVTKLVKRGTLPDGKPCYDDQETIEFP